MKTVLAIALTVLIVAPASFAVGVAKDPRVPGLQRRVKALEIESAALQTTAAVFDRDYVRQSIDQRVFAFCQALSNTGRNNQAKLNAEPVFSYFLNQVFTPGVACK